MYSTKREVVQDAFAEIGMGPYVFDLEPGMLERALRRMEAFVSEWVSAKKMRFGYPISSEPDLDDELDLPDVAENALVLNLAVIIAPGHGKEISQDLRTNAKRARNALLSWCITHPSENYYSRLPSGAGNKPGRTSGNFMPQSSESFPTDEIGTPNL